MTLEQLYTARQIADLFGFSASTIVDWYERGDLDGYRIGGRLRFTEAQILEFLERHRKAA